MDGLVTKEMFTKGGLVTEMFTLVNFQNFRKEKSLPTLHLLYPVNFPSSKWIRFQKCSLLKLNLLFNFQSELIRTKRSTKDSNHDALSVGPNLFVVSLRNIRFISLSKAGSRKIQDMVM